MVLEERGEVKKVNKPADASERVAVRGDLYRVVNPARINRKKIKTDKTICSI